MHNILVSLVLIITVAEGIPPPPVVLNSLSSLPATNLRSRRDVPISSYSRTDEGVEVALPQGGADDEKIDSDGSFMKNYETADGTKSKLSGAQGPQGQVMQGEYSFTAPDGSTITTKWTADEKGFQAEGPHLPLFKFNLGRR